MTLSDCSLRNRFLTVVLLALMFQSPIQQPARAATGKCEAGVLDLVCEAGKTVAEATGDVVSAPVRYAADSAVDTITTWVADTAHWLLGKVLNFLDHSTSPDLGADWFTERYRFMIGLASLVVLPMLVMASIRALVTQDLSQLLRSFFLYLPLALVGTSIAIFFTKALLSITDSLSSSVAEGIGGDAGRIFESVGQILGAGPVATPLPSFAIFIAALLLVIGSFFVWLELLVRSAAVTVSVFFLPLMLAALVWPATSRWTRRLVETLVALILSKFVIVGVISLATAALADPGGGGFGAVMGAGALMLMAAFSPMALLKLMPVVEGTAVSQLEGIARKPINSVRSGGSINQVVSMMRSKVGGGGAGGAATAGAAVATVGRRDPSSHATSFRPAGAVRSGSRLNDAQRSPVETASTPVAAPAARPKSAPQGPKKKGRSRDG